LPEDKLEVVPFLDGEAGCYRLHVPANRDSGLRIIIWFLALFNMRRIHIRILAL
jgi:hypothetical protein